MKATLEFDLPEDDYALKAAEQGQDCRCVLREMRDALRRRLKYESHPQDVVNALCVLQEEFFDSLRDYGIALDD